MADSDLFKKAKIAVDSLQALSHRRAALIKIRKQLLKNKNNFNAHRQDEPAKNSTSQDAHEGRAPQGFFDRIFDRANKSKSRSTMDYVPRTDFHEAHTMLHQPGTGNTNPEYYKF